MHQRAVINQLLAWIEQNLEQTLTLDEIATKAGYSKWHLQRMFKRQTGHVLGTYVRRRRLTAAARELRLTGTSVAIIADKYQFDSQQT
ncbi:helix-turn-helix domain-containing protein, partial [Serratia rubidaea]